VADPLPPIKYQRRANLPFRLGVDDVAQLITLGAVHVGLIPNGEYRCALSVVDGTAVISLREHPADDAPPLEIRW
jgi:hypothetical protein